jgi:hypothetical protein
MDEESQLPYIYVCMNNEGLDILKEDFNCPRCKNKMFEKRPTKDKYIVRNKERTVRLSCVCGYYRDDLVKPEDFKDDL